MINRDALSGREEAVCRNIPFDMVKALKNLEAAICLTAPMSAALIDQLLHDAMLQIALGCPSQVRITQLGW